MNRLAAGTLATLLLLLPVAARAGEVTPPVGHLMLELNALQPADKACRVTFLATNNLGAALDKSTFELAVFGADGAISRVVSADFKGLTAGKTKVLQFDLKDLACDSIGRVLVNDVTACSGAGIAAGACLAGLETSTKAKVTFGQ